VFDLTGEVAVVTGGGQGIGRAVAGALARSGAAVAVSDVDGGAATKTAEELKASACRAISVEADVTDGDSVASLADEASQLGPISVWVNNAGLTRPSMLLKMSVDDFESVMAVHARGTFLGLREAARRMVESRTEGCILNVTSSAGLQGTIGQINYSAAKGAITAMTKSAAKELARYRIRVNAIAPVAATPMTERLRTDPKLSERFLSTIPLGRFGEPDEIAATFVFVASRDAGYMTGQVVCVDGGLYMAS
jgi:3-oxoacyl-[acyl-carrier protein] reductase